jgi:UDP-N-acetyl-D-glucosamine dehydrogenase
VVTAASPANTTRVVVVGQGYVGLPVAMRAVEAGMHAVGFDVDDRKVDGLRAGRSHIGDVTDAEVAAALSTGRFTPTGRTRDLAGFDVAVITVPTPLRDGAPDLSHIESAAKALGRFLRPEATVVLESTTFPGTTEEIVGPILEVESGLRAGLDFHLGYSPERIDPGNTTWDFRRTPKVVSGIDDASLKAVQGFYDQLVDTTVAVRGCREAELCKLLENTFRHVNIALVNEMAIHARALDIDIWDVVRAASTKPFGFMAFHPGPGVGGHCLPIDPSYLSWRVERQLRTTSRFVKVANDVNDHMPDYVVRRVQLGLNDRERPVKGSRVLVLGVAYKPNTNDARETPATQVIEQLLQLGAEVRVHDTHVEFYDLYDRAPRVALTAEEIHAADVVVLLTDHSDVDYSLVASTARYVFDTRHLLEGDNVETL